METNYQKFLAGEYCNHLDQEVLQMIVQTKNLLARLNATNITDSATRDALLRQMLGSIGKYSSIDINFHCECGKHIFIGDKVIINMNCTFLDDNIIKIGNNVLSPSYRQRQAPQTLRKGQGRNMEIKTNKRRKIWQTRK